MHAGRVGVVMKAEESGVSLVVVKWRLRVLVVGVLVALTAMLPEVEGGGCFERYEHRPGICGLGGVSRFAGGCLFPLQISNPALRRTKQVLQDTRKFKVERQQKQTNKYGN